MFFRFRRDRRPTDLLTTISDRAHRVVSEYDDGLCRFVLMCRCGARYDTPYIDEALEYHELHEVLAPLADQLQH